MVGSRIDKVKTNLKEKPSLIEYILKNLKEIIRKGYFFQFLNNSFQKKLFEILREKKKLLIINWNYYWKLIRIYLWYKEKQDLKMIQKMYKILVF